MEDDFVSGRMMRTTEAVSKIEVLPSGEVLLGLRSGGAPKYQYIYREAAGVYWDGDLGGFVSRGRREWSCSEWVEHIVRMCQSLGIDLVLADTVTWVDVEDADKVAILRRRGK